MPQPKTFYSIRALAAPRTAEVFIFGDIGENWYGDSVAASEFVQEFAAIDADFITVRISSYGGSVTDGIAIYNAIKRHSAHITVSIESVAASIASLIAMAGDVIEMHENTLLMIHAPWGGIYGNAAQLREYADYLDTWAEAMASSYASKTGNSIDDMRALLTDGVDHWYTAQQALDEGFIDTITAAIPVAASLDLSRYKSLPAAAAAFMQQENPMPKPINNPAAPEVTPVAAVPAPQNPAPVEPTAADIEVAALAKDQQRRDAISASFKPFMATEGVSALMAACQNDHKCSHSDANAKLLAHMGKGAEPAAGHYAVVVEDSRDKFRSGVSASLLARAGIQKDDAKNDYRGYTLFELARMSLEQAGRRTNGLGKMDVVAAAFTHGTSDFTSLLANIAEKAMMRGYEEAEETFQLWTVVGELSDFKSATRVGMDSFPSLLEVRPGAEYKSATFGDRGETVQLATYGRKFGITRQAIINDDLASFTKIPLNMGRAAIRTVGDLVYAVLTTNPNMADGVALFHASHSNLLTAGAISTANVDAMRVAMAKQKDSTGNTLNIRLANLLVPVALEGAAKSVRDSEFDYDPAAKTNRTPNTVRGTFEVISDARLDAASASNWYGCANAGMHDTIEVSYLDGVQTPTLEQQDGWDVDGTEFKVRIDAAVKALEHRTLQKNPN